MDKFIQKCVDFLELQKPFRVILQSKMRDNAALYLAHHTTGGKLLRHSIKINLSNIPDDERNIKTLIAHEFIHAWQEEKGHTDIHGKSFQRMAEIMGKEFNLPKLYLPDTDIP